MTLITHQFLKDIGLTLDDTQLQALSEEIETDLRENVISRVVDSLDDEQAEDLAALGSADDDVLQQWLTANVPQLEEIVKQEANLLIDSIAEQNEL